MRTPALTILLAAFFTLASVSSFSQTAINQDGSLPDNSAMLDIKANDRGILIPRLSTTERNGLPSPAIGLLIYNSTTNTFNYFNGSNWCNIESTFVSSVTGNVSPGGGVSVNAIPNILPDNSAMLDVNNSNRGILLPRTIPADITQPATGLIIYNTASNRFNYYNGKSWLEITAVSTGQTAAYGSQTSIGYAIKSDGTPSDQSAMLEIASNNKGLLIPRLTNIQRDLILPAAGLMIYNSSTNAIEFFNGSGWYRLAVNFSCGQDFPDFRDGQTYKTTQIGPQCWLADNLNIGTMVMSTSTGSSHSDCSNNGMIEKYCYNNDSLKCDLYGGLYDWDEMMQYGYTQGSQGICPTGWHLPGDQEWKTLEGNIDSLYKVGDPIWNNTGWRGYNAGKNLKSGSGWANNGNGPNLFGFTGLPGGERLKEGNFVMADTAAMWWSSTQQAGETSWWRILFYNSNKVVRNYIDSKQEGLSVRCLITLNYPPNLGSFVPSGVVEQPLNTTLTWNCTDPENDPLTFKVYFGADNPPSLVASGISVMNYNPGSLSYNTKYYWRIEAYDNGNFSTGYTNWFVTMPDPGWMCGDTLLDVREDDDYPTVQIGTQCWMKKNLHYNKIYMTGYEEIYGGLYYWGDIIGNHVCPNGFHIPTDNEWTTLTNFLGVLAGGAMKETGTLLWQSPNMGATNSSGFSARPGGYGSSQIGFFEMVGYEAWFWSGTTDVNVPNQAWSRALSYNDPFVFRWSSPMDQFLSIRCMQNNLPPSVPTDPFPSDGAQNQPYNITLSWTCSDPYNEPLTFDVYFGSINPPPLLSSSQTNNSYNPGTLAYNTTWYWKIVASDGIDSTEGPVWSFSTAFSGPCPGIPTVIYDGQTYNTLKIGNQCWLKENLNIGTMIPGSSNMTNNGLIEKNCYNDNEAYCAVYGGLYRWNEMMQYSTTPGVQGICPTGWHLPTDAAWTVLTNYLGGLSVAGGKMKETGTAHWNSPNAGATNLSGFTALGGGYYGQSGFADLKINGTWWSSTESGTLNAWGRLLSNLTDDAFREYKDKNLSGSVRCIKD